MKKPIIILSAELSTLQPYQNDNRTLNIIDTFKASELLFKRVTGVYKGTKEVSFVVEPRDKREEKLVLSIAKHFDQECVLRLDRERKAELIYPTGKIEKIGRFKPVEKAIAEKFDNYTIDGDNYYVVV